GGAGGRAPRVFRGQLGLAAGGVLCLVQSGTLAFALLERGGHHVKRRGQLAQLAGTGLVGGAGGQVAAGQPAGGAQQPVYRPQDKRVAEQPCGQQRQRQDQAG